MASSSKPESKGVEPCKKQWRCKCDPSTHEDYATYKAKQKAADEALKMGYRKILENLECPICKDIILMTYTTNCAHSFCARCITEWRFKNNSCPVCRTQIENLMDNVEVDKMIKKLCIIIGDDVLEQRNNQLDECSKLLAQMDREAGKKPSNSTSVVWHYPT